MTIMMGTGFPRIKSCSKVPIVNVMWFEEAHLKLSAKYREMCFESGCQTKRRGHCVVT